MSILSFLTMLSLSSTLMLQEPAVADSESDQYKQKWQRVYSSYGLSTNNQFRIQHAIGLTVAPHKSTNSSYHLSSGYRVREATVYLFKDGFEGR